ncbi:hypothetical protein MIND_00208300 [Mycena indigotica]|uniref:Uncharacterized protein n=1 Tax=Mycena indigotica TaxID=2126181 RepID=A0A8H6T846_9AGAR|nr:uncharacterized protein MIND_00208300 [Mycena indigotica]KAF7311966.1 hypothetical protein MIND_00208300 [Mycena indigotica]
MQGARARPADSQTPIQHLRLSVDPKPWQLDRILAICADNIVTYLQMDDKQLVIRDPTAFKKKDVIEVGFTLQTYRTFSPELGPHYKCEVVLRSLVNLDGTFSKQVAAAKRAALKRKVHEVSSAKAEEKRWKRMRRNANPIAARFTGKGKGKELAVDSESDEGQPATRMKLEGLHLIQNVQKTD